MRAADTFVVDVAIVGAGAAGLATSIFVARRRPDLRVVALDGAKKIGAKILISGGGRCNVTHRAVGADDYFGGSRNLIRRVLAAFPIPATISFFQEIGVPLKEESPFGKLFPVSNSARSVLQALIHECQRLGVEIRADCRVCNIVPHLVGPSQQSLVAGNNATCESPPLAPKQTQSTDRFFVQTSQGPLAARCVVLATGGLSYPKTGSDGGGYELAKRLGHSLVPTTPALAALVLSGDFHAALTGISHEAELTVRIQGERPYRRRGPLLWTHFGVSGPEPMNIARVWHRARLECRDVAVVLNFLPGESAETVEAALIKAAAAQPRSSLYAWLSERLPERVAGAILARIGDPGVTLAHVTREFRRRAAVELTEFRLPVRDSRGYAHAEATAGGIPLSEIDPSTLESRCCPGLFLAGEILDVDGRIGGFNFQWAWSSGFVAGGGIDKALSRPRSEP